ncbi:MAG: MBOAT family protein [Saprospiraceae bacterium]|nr:MBOAT family protein [Saprospiraceae bacterium]
MVFNSITFLVFSLVFFPLYFALKGRPRLWWILGMSYLFYGWWDWRFLSLIALSTVMDFYFGAVIGRTDDARQRRQFLAFSMVMNLGFLGVFKYLNFFIDSFAALLHGFGLSVSMSSLEIILPVGISFYTFQSMSYTIDVYRREIPVERNLLKFAAFIALFPQLVAGPIIRARDLLYQMEEDKRFDWTRLYSGLGRILWGFFKKVAVADSLAPFVDQVFNAPETFGSAHLLIGVVFYSFQIYCDFSGYSDIAIGLARIMGYHFPENFNTPYFSRSFSEFWSRWHISLSSWLRDYLYIPLGGNRHGKWNTYRNNMLTMLLGGLWHGANLAFVFWGFLHGLYLIVQRAVSPLWRGVVHTFRLPRWFDAMVSMVVVYAFTLLAWVYFRSGSIGLAGGDSFGTANQVLRGIFSGEGLSWGAVINKFQALKGLLLIAILLTVEASNFRWRWNAAQVGQPVFRLAAFAVLLWMIAFFGTFGGSAFIYFQF